MGRSWPTGGCRGMGEKNLTNLLILFQCTSTFPRSHSFAPSMSSRVSCTFCRFSYGFFTFRLGFPVWNLKIFLRCVIPVVLSNNNNKLMVHMCIVKNTTIFLIVRLLLLRYNYMFRPSMLAIFRLYMKHLMISYIYT